MTTSTTNPTTKTTTYRCKVIESTCNQPTCTTNIILPSFVENNVLRELKAVSKAIAGVVAISEVLNTILEEEGNGASDFSLRDNTFVRGGLFDAIEVLGVDASGKIEDLMSKFKWEDEDTSSEDNRDDPQGGVL